MSNTANTTKPATAVTTQHYSNKSTRAILNKDST
jgi:hypothetical protein